MTRRGLTLLEVVLATALLAMAAVGVASAVSAITPSAERRDANPGELTGIVDAALRDPVRSGLDPAAIAASGRGVLRVDEITIEVTLESRSGRGAWMVFHLGDQHVARWVRVPEVRP